MTRQELVAWRNNLQTAVDERKRLGGYDTNAPAILFSLEANLALATHLLENLKADDRKAKQG